MLMSARAARAQPPDSPQSASAFTAWRAAAGYETFAFRDIASTRPPVDASPVRWIGTGPAIALEYGRVRPARLHQFAFTTTTSGGFVYETGVDSTPRPVGDSARFIEGRYDYRRTLARSIGLQGLEGEIGARGAVERRTFRHELSGAVLRETDSLSSIAFVAGLRYHAKRVGLRGEWSNAAMLARARRRHETAALTEISGWGAGWLTDVAAHMDVRIAPPTALVVSYLRRGEGVLLDHRAYTDERRRVTFGLTYAR
jgi:hypothetical protein